MLGQLSPHLLLNSLFLPSEWNATSFKCESSTVITSSMEINPTLQLLTTVRSILGPFCCSRTLGVSCQALLTSQMVLPHGCVLPSELVHLPGLRFRTTLLPRLWLLAFFQLPMGSLNTVSLSLGSRSALLTDDAAGPGPHFGFVESPIPVSSIYRYNPDICVHPRPHLLLLTPEAHNQLTIQSS